MTCELQSTLGASEIEWPALRNHIPCMAHVIQLALCAFMHSLGVKGRTKSWKAHERDQQFGENESIDIGKSQRLRKEGIARINKVLAMRSGLAKIIEKVRISWYFESPEADVHIAENACCINYGHTWSPKLVNWLSNSQSLHCSTSDKGCEDTLELYSGVARACLPRMASESKIRWILATIHNSGWMDDCQQCHGSIVAISILHPLDIEEAYSHIASCYHSVPGHVPSHGWRDVSFGQDQDSMEGRLVLRYEVRSTEALQELHRSDSNDGHATDFRTKTRFIKDVAIIYKVGHGNGYQSWWWDILHYTIPRCLSEVCGEWILFPTLTCTSQ
jgi:hypothetical protein